MFNKLFFKRPKGSLIAILSFLTAISAVSSKEYGGIITVIIAIFSCLFFEFVGSSLQNREKFTWDGAVITGFIIGLVLSVDTSWVVILLTSGIAIGSKHVFRYKRKPIFNPAAFGLFAAIVIFSTEQSWWGVFADTNALLVILVLLSGYFIVNRVQKFNIFFSFLGCYFALLLIMAILHIGDASSAFRTPFVNSALFLGLFMATDPPTSPSKPKEQIAFGAICAIVGSIVYAIFGGLSYLYIGLLLANFLFFLVSYSRSKSREKPRL